MSTAIVQKALKAVPYGAPVLGKAGEVRAVAELDFLALATADCFDRLNL